MAKTAGSLYHCRVYYAETDAGGVVYHAAFLNYAERARCEWLRELGYSVADLQYTHGLIFAVRNCDIEYLAPAKLDQELTITTHLLHMGGASLGLEQIIRHQDAVLTRLKVTLVAVTTLGKTQRLPEELREKLQPYLQAA
ncbi:MAG: YbgC/FadM family acyl-CoA thioesterase [Dongiaceae bacterium]